MTGKLMSGAAVLLLAAAAGACTPRTVVPPILSLDGHACATQFDLISARSLQPQESVTVTIDERTPCWQSADGTKSTYLAFHLPASPAPYLAQVTSLPQDGNLLPPRLFITDFQGTVLRQQPRENFLTHGASLSASMRIYPGDYALIVASDPASIGTQSAQIIGTTKTSTTTATSSAGTVAVTLHTGDERAVTSISSYNGIVTVSVKPMPKSE